MVRTDGDVNHCPYCGAEAVDGYWEREVCGDWIHVCLDCGERFKIANVNCYTEN